jgi:hypothetical protein
MRAVLGELRKRKNFLGEMPSRHLREALKCTVG